MSQSLNNIVRIMECLSSGTNRFTDIFRELEMPQSTLHRLLESMVESGLAIQDPVRRLYYLGPIIYNLASNSASSHQNLISMAQSELRWLRSKTKETIALHSVVGAYQTCLDEHVSIEPIKMVIGKGEISLLVFGASGRVLLSQFDKIELRLTKEKISNLLIKDKKRSHLLTAFDQLDEIRKRGYAKSSGERIDGSTAFSAPVYNYHSPISLSVMGPEDRMKRKEYLIIQALLKSSERLSALLLSNN